MITHSLSSKGWSCLTFYFFQIVFLQRSDSFFLSPSPAECIIIFICRNIFRKIIGEDSCWGWRIRYLKTTGILMSLCIYSITPTERKSTPCSPFRPKENHTNGSYLSKNKYLWTKHRAGQTVMRIWPFHQKHTMCLNEVKGKTKQNTTLQYHRMESLRLEDLQCHQVHCQVYH